MKKAISILSTILVLFLAFGCNSSDDSNVSSGSDSGTETSFNFTMTSFKSQETASSSLGAQADFTADQIMTGQLTATPSGGGTAQVFDWSIYFDETTWDVQSNKTIILAPGTYDFSLLITKGSQEYAGTAAGVSISDGTFDVPMTISPVIGDTVTDVTLVASLADFKFQYDPAELSAASLTNPQMGIIVDGGTEEVFTINPATGISDNYVNLPEGSHTVQLKLYEASLQVGRSITAQESVIITAGLDLAMDLVALHGETTFALTEAGGDANFQFNIPAEVVDEAGGLGNLQVLFSLVGDNNPLEETVLSLSADASGDYEASVTLTNKQFDTITATLTFTDTSVPEQLGSCVMESALDTTQRTLNCDVTLRRRAIVGGSLLETIGVNVFNELGEPTAGVKVGADDELVGFTGSGAFGTPGYLKTYLTSGSHHLKALSGNKYGIADTVSLPLQIQNIDITLDSPFNEGIEVTGDVVTLFREKQFPLENPLRMFRGLDTTQHTLTQISSNLTINSFSTTGSRARAALQLLYSPNGFLNAEHLTIAGIDLRAEEGNLFQIAYVSHCLDVACMTFEAIGPTNGDFQQGMSVATGVPHSAAVEYLGDGSSFQFSVNGQTTIIDASALANFSYFDPADSSRGRISLRLDDLGPSYGDYASISASYDNVYVNNVLYDDFSDLNTSLTKWNNWQF